MQQTPTWRKQSEKPSRGDSSNRQLQRVSKDGRDTGHKPEAGICHRLLRWSVGYAERISYNDHLQEDFSEWRIGEERMNSEWTEVVINTCSDGGFSLSQKADTLYKELVAPRVVGFSHYIPRDDPALIQVVKKLKEAANGLQVKLKIVEIPSNVNWKIEECNGVEWIAEVHRTWR